MLGTVTSLRRYPVKSMPGEALDAGAVRRAGLDGDRRPAGARRPTGQGAGANDPLPWRGAPTRSPQTPGRTGGSVDGLPENDWCGRDLRVGADVVLRVIARTPRCAVPTLAHGDLPRDAEALRVLARHNRVSPMAGSDPEPCAGVYAEVLRPGRIRVGDAVRVRAASRVPAR